MTPPEFIDQETEKKWHRLCDRVDEDGYASLRQEG
jgi:hypothetical protein